MEADDRPTTRVLDLSAGLAGAYCTKLLADAGCDVVRIEPAGGDPLRTWSASGRRPAAEEGVLSRFLAGRKRRLPAGAAIDHLVATADVIVTGPGVTPPPAGHRDDAVVVAITPWGSTGPWADRPWSEFTLQAESGGLGGRGMPGDVPFQAGGRTMEWAAGTYAALAALAAARTGRGEVVDVSMLAVACVVAGNYGDLHHRLAPGDLSVPAQTIETPSIEPTADGYVGFTTNSRQQFDDFLVLIERFDLLGDDEMAAARNRLRRLDEWLPAVHAWTTARTTEEVVQRASDLRIPVAPLGNGRTVVEQEAFAGRGVFLPDPETGHRQPRRPYRLDFQDPPPPEPPADVADVDWAPRSARPVNPGLPLEGVRIVDLTAWWAGPAGAHALATLGADVIHVESLARPDGMRMAGGMLQGKVDAWWEHSAFFLCANAGKRGVTLDFTTPDGHALLERLIASCDAVVENFTPRVLENVGLGWDRIHEINPAAILLRMPAFGLDGPWRDRPGFAQTMEQLSGLAWLTGHADDQPRIQRGPCDPIAGMHAAIAFLVALQQRDTTGRGVHVEASMAEVALTVAAEQLLEHEAYGALLERSGNRSPGIAPQGLYRSADDRWVAVSITTDEQWVALTDLLGSPGPFETFAERVQHHDELDDWLSKVTADRSADELVTTLVAAGVPAGVVRDPRLASTHPQLGGLFEEVAHPEAGTHPTPTVPFRFASVPRWTRRPAPTLGQHNREVLAELLGLTDAELDALVAAATLGTRPLHV